MAVDAPSAGHAKNARTTPSCHPDTVKSEANETLVGRPAACPPDEVEMQVKSAALQTRTRPSEAAVAKTSFAAGEEPGGGKETETTSATRPAALKKGDAGEPSRRPRTDPSAEEALDCRVKALLVEAPPPPGMVLCRGGPPTAPTPAPRGGVLETPPTMMDHEARADGRQVTAVPCAERRREWRRGASPCPCPCPCPSPSPPTPPPSAAAAEAVVLLAAVRQWAPARRSLAPPPAAKEACCQEEEEEEA